MIVERDEGGENGDASAGNAEREPSAILFDSPAKPVDGVHRTLEKGGHGEQLLLEVPFTKCPPIILTPLLHPTPLLSLRGAL